MITDILKDDEENKIHKIAEKDYRKGYIAGYNMVITDNWINEYYNRGHWAGYILGIKDRKIEDERRTKIMHKRKSWDSYYHDIAKRVAERSPCLSRKIGAILVKDMIVICEGYNGPARGVPHCGPERLEHDHSLAHIMDDASVSISGDAQTCPRRCLGFPSGQGLEYCPAVHAEANCIANAARIGIQTIDTSMYLTCNNPCKDCLSLIINAGIKEVIIPEVNYYDELSKFILNTSDIIIRTYEKEDI